MSHKYPLVHLEWDDAGADNKWLTASDIEIDEDTVTTVGFVVKETDRHVIIASTYWGSDVNATIQIPKKMIVSRKTLVRAKRG